MEECGVTYTSAEELIQDVLHDQTMEDYNRYAAVISLRAFSVFISSRQHH